MSNENQLVNQLSIKEWISATKASRETVSLTCALFEHSDTDRVFLMTESAGEAVRFDVSRTDISDISEAKTELKFFGQSFRAANLKIRLDAVVVRVSIHEARELLESMNNTEIKNFAGATMQVRNTILANAVMR